MGLLSSFSERESSTNFTLRLRMGIGGGSTSPSVGLAVGSDLFVDPNSEYMSAVCLYLLNLSKQKNHILFLAVVL